MYKPSINANHTQTLTDTTVKIWDYLYKVRIPYVESRSVDFLKKFGIAMTGVKEIDRDRKSEWITSFLPISIMVDLYKNSISIKVVKYEDTKEIYNAISDHIQAWKTQLEQGINIGDAPVEDLIAMDEFANLVYDHAKYQFTREIAASFFKRDMQRFNPFGINGFGNRNMISLVTGESDISREEDEIKERDSLSDFFKNSLITFGG